MEPGCSRFVDGKLRFERLPLERGERREARPVGGTLRRSNEPRPPHRHLGRSNRLDDTESEDTCVEVEGIKLVEEVWN